MFIIDITLIRHSQYYNYFLLLCIYALSACLYRSPYCLTIIFIIFLFFCEDEMEEKKCKNNLFNNSMRFGKDESELMLLIFSDRFWYHLPYSLTSLFVMYGYIYIYFYLPLLLHPMQHTTYFMMYYY